MATPTLRALRNHYGRRMHIVGVHRPYVGDVLAGSRLLDDTIEFDPRSKDPELRTRTVIKKLRGQHFDTALLLPNSLRTAVISWAARIPQRIGYVRYGRRPFLTETLQPPKQDGKLVPISAVDYYLQLAKTIGADIDNPRIELGATASDEKKAERVWSKFGLHGDRVVAINTGGAYGAAKSWPAEHFAQTARKMIDQQGAKVMVVCGPSERETAREIQRLTQRDQIFTLADEDLNIGLTKSIIRRCQLLISTDSGPRFFGSAFDVPTLTIFGPTDPRWSEPRHPLSENIRKQVPCGPCAKRVCPLGHHNCMRDLTPDFVVSAAMNLWARSRRGLAA